MGEKQHRNEPTNLHREAVSIIGFATVSVERSQEFALAADPSPYRVVRALALVFHSLISTHLPRLSMAFHAWKPQNHAARHSLGVGKVIPVSFFHRIIEQERSEISYGWFP